MPGRSSKPLIEMMTGRRPSGSASPAPPAPRLSPPSQKHPSPPARTASSPEEHATYTVRLTSIYLGGAILLTLGVLLYAGGYKIGWNAGQDQFASSLGASVDDHLEPIRDPISDPQRSLPDNPVAVRTEPLAPQGGAPQRQGEPEHPPPRKPPIQTPPPGKSVLDVGSGPIITYAGMVQGDPRTPGVNYVQLVDLPRAQAVAAIEYLAAHNERAIAVPLERRAREPNNPWYRLFSLEVPVPSEQFAAMGRDRRDHIRRVAQIGQRWRREERGGSDFSTAFYSKYTP